MSLVRRLSVRVSRYFGIFAVLPFSGREDDGRNDHDERDKDSRLTNPQRRPSAFTRWIERAMWTFPLAIKLARRAQRRFFNSSRTVVILCGFSAMKWKSFPHAPAAAIRQ